MPRAALPTPDRIFDLITGYWQTDTLKAAVALDLFSALGRVSRTAGELAKMCNADRDGLRRLCDSLVGIGLLRKRGQRFRSAPDACHFLDHRSPHALADLPRWFNEPPLTTAFATLAASVRAGGTVLGGEGFLTEGRDVWEAFARTVWPLRRLEARYVIDELVAMRVAGRDILDIGCGGSPLGIALLERDPDATLVAQDRSNVVRVALERAAELGVADRMTSLEGSALDVALGGPYDLVLLMNVLEHFDRTSRRLLARRLLKALRPGGAVVTYAPLLDPARTTPPIAVRYSLFPPGDYSGRRADDLQGGRHTLPVGGLLAKPPEPGDATGRHQIRSHGQTLTVDRPSGIYNGVCVDGGHMTIRTASRFTFALVVALVSASAATAQEPADLILHNGKIFTSDNQMSIYSTVVIRDGEIIGIGTDALTSQYRADRLVDLAGRLVTPGFIDTHIHMRGAPRWQTNLAGSRSMDELLGRVTAKADEMGPGEWVTGVAWSEDELAEGRKPTRQDLDRAAPANPVVITRAGSHSSIANTSALDLAEVTVDTVPPEGGIIEIEDGRLNGALREGAQGLVRRLVPEPTADEVHDSFVQALRNLLPLGITSIVQAGARQDDFTEWERIYAEFGEELPRASVMFRVSPDPDGAIADIRRFGKITGEGDERLRVGALKMGIDGGYTGPAAWTLEPYKGQSDFIGSQLISKAELGQIVRFAHTAGWQMGFHTIGDAAVKLAVDVFAETLQQFPKADHRHFVNHFTVLPPPETMRSMAEHNIHIAQQPNFTYTLEGRYSEHLTAPRLATNNALRTPMDYGVFVALGSDVLPIGPMVGLYASVTRKGMSGKVHGPGERISMSEAIIGYTRNGSYLTFEEDRKGTLEVGKLADLIVHSDDLLTVDPERIMDVTIDMTIVDGKILYER